MGVLLSTPLSSTFVQQYGNPHMKVAVATMHGHRRTMEDAHTVNLKLRNHPHLALMAVFDGHGGQDTSTLLSTKLVECFEKSNKPDNPDIIKQIFIDLDVNLRSDIADRSGSTACVVLFNNKTREATFINLGDSRGIVYNSDGTITFQTTDHKPSDHIELQRIRTAGGYVSNNRVNGDLALSRAFGDFRFKCNSTLAPWEQSVSCEPDVTKVILEPGNNIMICCDGLLEQLKPEDLTRHVTSTEDPADRLVDLLHKSLNAGSQDNMSAIVVQFGDGQKYGGVQLYSPMRLTPEQFAADDLIEAYIKDARKHGMSLKMAILRSMTDVVSCRYSPPVDATFKMLVEKTPEDLLVARLRELFTSEAISLPFEELNLC